MNKIREKDEIIIQYQKQEKEKQKKLGLNLDNLQADTNTMQ